MCDTDTDRLNEALKKIVILIGTIDKNNERCQMMQDARDLYFKDWKKAEADNKVLRDALEPFAHPDLCKPLVGNMKPEDAVYGRDKAVLKLGDFINARTALEASE